MHENKHPVCFPKKCTNNALLTSTASTAAVTPSGALCCADGRAVDLQAEPHRGAGEETAGHAERSLADAETDGSQSDEGAGRRWREELAGVQQKGGATRGLDQRQGESWGHVSCS